jgi:hypothetical protein
MEAVLLSFVLLALLAIWRQTSRISAVLFRIAAALENKEWS